MWREILRAQCESRGLAAVALQLGYSKSTLSLVCSGKYGADTHKIEEAVLQHFGMMDCPFEGKEIPVQSCTGWSQRPIPTSSSWALQHWSACLSCPNNLTKENP